MQSRSIPRPVTLSGSRLVLLPVSVARVGRIAVLGGHVNDLGLDAKLCDELDHLGAVGVERHEAQVVVAEFHVLGRLVSHQDREPAVVEQAPDADRRRLERHAALHDALLEQLLRHHHAAVHALAVRLARS